MSCLKRPTYFEKSHEFPEKRDRYGDMLDNLALGVRESVCVLCVCVRERVHECVSMCVFVCVYRVVCMCSCTCVCVCVCV